MFIKKILLIGLIVFILLACFSFFSPSFRIPEAHASTTVSYQPNCNVSDAGRRLHTDYWLTTEGSNFVGDYDNVTYYEYGCGILWSSVTVPKSAIINDAYINFAARVADTADFVKTQFHGELIANSAAFTTSANFDAKTRTSAVVNWDNGGRWTKDQTYKSANITSIIQEIVNQGTWASGNNLTVFWDDFIGRSANAQLHEAYAYDSNVTGSPKLFITWSSNPPVNVPSPTCTNLDGGKFYAQLRYYIFIVNVTDADGATDIDNVTLWVEEQNTFTTVGVQWKRSTNIFSKVGTDSDRIDISTLSSSLSITNGYSLNMTVKMLWNYGTAGMVQTAVTVVSYDSYGNSDSDFTIISAFQPIMTATFYNVGVDDSRININSNCSLSGYINYTDSILHPPDNDTGTVSAKNASYTYASGTTSSGHFSISVNPSPSVVSTNVFAYNGLVGVNSGNIPVVTDRIKILTLGSQNATTRVNTGSVVTYYATANLEYDNHGLGAGDSLVLGGKTFSYNTTHWVCADTESSAGIVTINAFTSGSEATYGITAGNINSLSASAIWDSVTINAASLVFSNGRLNIGITGTFSCTAQLAYDGHVLGAGDSLTLSSHIFTYNGTHWVNTTTQSSPGSLTINALTSVNEATYGITVGSINGNTATGIWDALTTFNVQTPQYYGNGAFYYQAQVEWASDNITINGATVGAAYPNGTSISSMTSNSTGWVSFIINQGNATNGNLAIYGINDNNYTITVTFSNATFTLYDWALNTKDIAGSSISNTNLAITIGAISVWSGTQRTLYIPADTFAVSITWLQSLPVNTTASVTVAGATSTDFNCTIYALTGTSYHFASNTTITSNSYSSDVFSVSFSGATSTYLLVVDKPVIPTYIINATYDITTVYTPYTYLVLPHYGNQSVQVSYEWGTIYLKKTTHKFLAVSLVGQTLTVTATGTIGDLATIELYCGTRGNPATMTGFIATSYSATLSTLTGTFTFASDKILTVSWVSSGGGPGTGGTQSPAISPLIATVILNFPYKNTQGTTINATVTITWSGVTVVYLQEIFIDDPTFATWQLLIPDGLPQTLTAFGTMGTADIPITVHIPDEVEPGTYIVPCVVSFGWESGSGTKTFRTVSTLEIVLPPPTVPDLMTYWWVGMFAALGVGMLVLRSRKH